MLKALRTRVVGTQLRLLHSGWRALRPGGCLVYSTCTFNYYENEGAVGGRMKFSFRVIFVRVESRSS